MAQLPVGISKGFFGKGFLGVAALSLVFGAVAFGRDLRQQGLPSQLALADASSTSINRTPKTDRVADVPTPAVQTQTVSVKLSDLSNTSVLIRVPIVLESSSGMTPASLLTNPGTSKATVACEPTVSVLTEVAKQLQPGRCVT